MLNTLLESDLFDNKYKTFTRSTLSRNRDLLGLGNDEALFLDEIEDMHYNIII
ncbi:sigma 54-interacting transcriptional regulator [Proteiniborus ethanoligenes]|uniref:sigma 54-interacting transcriptional regulator n=1 Tax=Proteiniborus ethanoligenes TaxID=415015 RepID=UPI003CC7A3C7